MPYGGKVYEKAVRHKKNGNWTLSGPNGNTFCHFDLVRDIDHFVLSVRFWQALGKTEGWEEEDIWTGDFYGPDWLLYMHRMIDALAEGKSIKEFLATL